MKQSYFRISFLQFPCNKDMALCVFDPICLQTLRFHYALCIVHYAIYCTMQSIELCTDMLYVPSWKPHGVYLAIAVNKYLL